MSKFYHILVVGAGASGMMAAITAAKNRKKVLLIDRCDKIGKKIYATGNGKCNFTNEFMDISCFHGNLELAANGLEYFNHQDTIHFFHELGILSKSKNGYLYPNSEQASSVVKAMEKELSSLGVDLLLSTEVSGIECQKNGFKVWMNEMEYRVDKIIFATGLLASPKLGSDGSILPMIKNLGHRFTKILPALTGFYCDGFSFKQSAGVRQTGLVTLWDNQQFVEENYGEIQFTDYGLSGIPIFQISSNAIRRLDEGHHVEIGISFFPEYTPEELLSEIKYRALMLQEEDTISDLWNGLLNDKLCMPIIAQVGLKPQDMLCKLQEQDYKNIVDALLYTRVSVQKSKGFEQAQVCTGGIRSEEINIKTLESKIVKDIYFCGELLDVDGICGGYNLQWAFSSGYLAGDQASR